MSFEWIEMQMRSFQQTIRPENKSLDTTTNQVLRLFVHILLQLFSIRIYLRNLFNPKTACTRCPSSIVPHTRIVTGQLSRHHKHSLFLRIKFYWSQSNDMVMHLPVQTLNKQFNLWFPNNTCSPRLNETLIKVYGSTEKFDPCSRIRIRPIDRTVLFIAQTRSS